MSVTMRMPALLPFGEGRASGEAIDTCTRSIRRREKVEEFASEIEAGKALEVVARAKRRRGSQEP